MDLTPREEEVLDRWLEGKEASEIGDELYIETRSVHNHLHRIREKYGANNVRHLTVLATAGLEPMDMKLEDLGKDSIIVLDPIRVRFNPIDETRESVKDRTMDRFEQDLDRKLDVGGWWGRAEPGEVRSLEKE